MLRLGYKVDVWEHDNEIPADERTLATLAAEILASVERHPERVALATRALIVDMEIMRAYLARFKD